MYQFSTTYADSDLHQWPYLHATSSEFNVILSEIDGRH